MEPEQAVAPQVLAPEQELVLALERELVLALEQAVAPQVLASEQELVLAPAQAVAPRVLAQEQELVLALEQAVAPRVLGWGWVAAEEVGPQDVLRRQVRLPVASLPLALVVWFRPAQVALPLERVVSFPLEQLVLSPWEQAAEPLVLQF